MRNFSRIERSLGIALVAVAAQMTFAAKAELRSVLYSYDQSGTVIFVTVSDSGNGPKGQISAVRLYVGGPPLRKNFTMSQAEFEKVWSTLDAPGVENDKEIDQAWSELLSAHDRLQ